MMSKLLARRRFIINRTAGFAIVPDRENADFAFRTATLRDYETFSDALRLLTESRVGRKEMGLLGSEQAAAAQNRHVLSRQPR